MNPVEHNVSASSPSKSRSSIAALDPVHFFQAWKKVCDENTGTLLAKWESGGDYSAAIFGPPATSVVSGVGAELGLDCYFNYYSLDAVYFVRDADAVSIPPAPPGSTWLKNIRIAFEHENYFRSGLFQEVSHLMITRADLRVLVTYPEAFDDEVVKRELGVLHRIIFESNLADPNFLVITGKRKELDAALGWSAIEWTGRVYTPSCWVLCDESQEIACPSAASQ